MGREIKFRAWNGECMVSPDYIDRDGVAWWKENSIPTCCKEPEQFTGLLDKNGKEIYEHDEFQYGKTTHYVGWNEVHSQWWGYWRDGLPAFPLDRDRASLIEVIGNIHENPELVK